MRKLLSVALTLLLPTPQGIGGKGGVGGAGGFTGATPPSVSVDSSNYYATGALSSCANSSPSGNPCQITTTFVVPHTGDAVDVTVALCWAAGCNAGTAGTLTLTDGTNTYVAVAAATQVLNAWNLYRFVACNATAGTYTLVFHDSANDAVFDYVRASAVTLLAAHTPTGCVDTSVSSVATGNSAAPSITSAGNVTSGGEVAVAFITCSGTFPTNTGSYSTLIINNTDATLLLAKVNPTSGATTTAAGTCTAGSWFASLLAVNP